MYLRRHRLKLQILNDVTIRLSLQRLLSENLRVTEVFQLYWILNPALLMLIFFVIEMFQGDLRCVEVTRKQCGHGTKLSLSTKSTLKIQYRLTVFKHSDCERTKICYICYKLAFE